MPGRPKLRRLEQRIAELGGDDFVFDQIADGKTIEEIAAQLRGCVPQDPDFPHRTTLYRWKKNKDGREEAWKAAQKIAAHSLVSEAEEIVENKIGPNGEPVAPASSAELGWLKARAELRRKRAAEYNPEEYGEKQQQGVNINVDLGQLYLGALREKGSMELAPGRNDEPELLEAEIVEDED